MKESSKYFRFCGSYSLCHNCSTLSLLCESNHEQYINEWTCLCPKNMSFTKTDGGLDWPMGHCLPMPALCYCCHAFYFYVCYKPYNTLCLFCSVNYLSKGFESRKPFPVLVTPLCRSRFPSGIVFCLPEGFRLTLLVVWVLLLMNFSLYLYVRKHLYFSCAFVFHFVF